MESYNNILFFDRYRATEVIKEDSVFFSYSGIDSETDSKVIIQILKPDRYTRYDVDRICFINDIKSIRELDHPNILRLLQAGVYGKTVVIVYEYTDFVFLSDYLDTRQDISLKSALEMTLQLSEALRYAESRNISHRHITPHNICISETPEGPKLKLFGFGMSSIIDFMNGAVTDIDYSFGCIAPEATGLLDRKVDNRSDLYSVGVILYRFLTGSMPFHSDSIDNIIYQHVAVAAKSPCDSKPSIPSAIASLDLKLLAKNPDLRYQSASELSSELYKILSNDGALDHIQDRDFIASLDRKSVLYSRKKELAKLREAFTDAREKQGKVCLIRGDLGSGKTDLINSMTAGLSRERIPCYKAKFTSQNSMTPYSAFHGILDEFIDDFEKYDRKTQLTERSRLGKTISGMSDIVTSICSDMVHVLPAAGSLPALDDYKEHQRSLGLLAKLFISLYPAEVPYVLILDGLQHADSASLQLLGEIVSIIDDSKVFLVCTARDTDQEDNPKALEFYKTLSASSNFVDIPLLPYDEKRLLEYLTDMLGISREEAQAIAPYLLEKAGGNPYFTLNVLKSMFEDNLISIRSGRLEQDWSRISTASFSDLLNGIISKRLSSLPEASMPFFETAAVIGTEFSLDILLEVTGCSKDIADCWIAKALDLQFIEYASSHDILTFSHSDIHKAFLDKLTAAETVELHRKIAHVMEAAYPSHEVSLYALIYHYSEAGDEEGVYRHILEAAAQSRSSNANDTSLAYYTRALALIEKHEGQTSKDWFAVRRAIIELSLTAGHFTDAITAAEDLINYLTNPLDKAAIFSYIGTGYFRQSRFDKCEEVLLRALDFLGEHVPKSSASLRLNSTILKFNRYFASVVVQDPTLREHRNASEKILTVIHIFDTLCWLYIYTDLVKFKYTALYLYGYVYMNLGPSPELASAASMLAVYYMLEHKKQAAEIMQTFSNKLNTSLNNRYGAAQSSFFTAMGMQWNNKADESIKAFQQVSAEFRSIGDHWQLNNALNYEAVSHLYLGEYQDSINICNEVIKKADKLEDLFSLCHAYTTLINCYTETSDLINASAAATAAQPYVESLNLPYISALFGLACGRMLYEQGHYEEAASRFKTVCDIIRNNNFIIHYCASAFGYYQLARIKLLDKTRSNMAPIDAQKLEQDIGRQSEEAMILARNVMGQSIPAFRACALIGIITERFRYTEEAYVSGSHAAARYSYRYENAMLDYEYGRYLLSKHKTKQARFYIFEAYMEFSSISSPNYQKECEDLILDRFHEKTENNALLSNASASRQRMNADRKINTLLKLGELLTSTLEIEDLQKQILQEAVELVGAERGILFLYPETGPHTLYVASIYNAGRFDCNTYDWMLSEVERTQKPIVINDVQSDEYRRHYADLACYGIKSVMATPMFVRGEFFGVIYLDSRLVRSIFSDDYLETIGFIANQAGAPIQNARLYHKAVTDALTDIYGRSYLDNLITDKTASPDTKVAALMLDVDHFKSFNDTYGHAFGDKVLIHIAGIMKQLTKDCGVACRYGGEEFVVLLDTSDPDFALSIAEKIRQSIESSSIALNDENGVRRVSVTVSIGVSIWGPGMERVELVEHADKAMYYAKEHGRNRVSLWTGELSN